MDGLGTEVFTDPTAYDRTHTGDEASKARNRILPWILIGYLAMLAISVAVPLIVAPRLTGPEVQQVRDLMLTLSGLSQGLFGVLGVVVGYYFRNDDAGTGKTTGT